MTTTRLSPTPSVAAPERRHPFDHRTDIGAPRLVVLASGHGGTLETVLTAIRIGRLRFDVVGVVSHRSSARALSVARDRRVRCVFQPMRLHEGRLDDETSVLQTVRSWRPDVVLMAGWDRVMSERFLESLPPVLNLHPSLPGDLVGRRCIERAQAEFERGDRLETGVMVHRATADLDRGPVLAQETVTIEPTGYREAMKAAETRVVVRALSEWSRS